MRIAVGGFQHETNTFAPSKATFEDFALGGAWPPLSRGDAMLDAVAGINIPIAGFVERIRMLGHEVLPLSWAAATPSAHVTEDAYERIAAQILDDLSNLRGLDAVYLDLHGAMVTEHLEDGEGELLRRVRNLVASELPIVASLDLHANVTAEMIACSDLLVAYRTYPHVDMAETGARCATLLDRCFSSGGVPAKAHKHLPFLVPITSGCTLHDPAMSIYRRLEELEKETGGTLSFAPGFSPADIRECGPSVFCYAPTQAGANSLCEALAAEVAKREGDFRSPIWTPREAVAYANKRSREVSRPFVLADTQDNPGAGANGDTVGLLRELVEQRSSGAVLGLLCDAEAAAAAHEAGEGSDISLSLGAKSGLPGEFPVEAKVHVEKLGDGQIVGTGPFYRGARMHLGPMALLRIGAVHVAVASRKMQAADQEVFRHLGIEPKEQKILALKSSVHFRADFQPIAEEVLIVAAPGPNPVDHLTLDYKRLRKDVRLMPLGPARAS